jgi:putative flippase GtrA
VPTSSFARFCVVGIINTLIDVPVFVVLHSAGLSVLLANIISTSLALVASLLLNYRYTFQGRSLTKARIGLYFAVTLVGIWILQPLVISGFLALNAHTGALNFLTDRTGHVKQITSLFAKLGSLAVSLIWNYSWYNRVVFTMKPEPLASK